jgi:hypothetical protein
MGEMGVSVSEENVIFQREVLTEVMAGRAGM